MNKTLYAIEKIKVLNKIIGGFYADDADDSDYPQILTDEAIDDMLCDEEFAEMMYNGEMMYQPHKKDIIYALCRLCHV
jgi:hypothetical protein